jgi:uncharacterized protein (DUF1778 family)
MKRRKDARRETLVHVRFLKAEKAIVDRAAAKQRRTMSNWIINAVLDAAERQGVR